MGFVFLICLTSFVRMYTNLPYFWTGKSVGGCHLLHNGTGLNMGFVVGPPVAVTDSTLVIRYKSGDVCNHRSALKHYRSTTIMFHCSLQQASLCILVVVVKLTTFGLSVSYSNYLCCFNYFCLFVLSILQCVIHSIC